MAVQDRRPRASPGRPLASSSAPCIPISGMSPSYTIKTQRSPAKQRYNGGFQLTHLGKICLITYVVWRFISESGKPPHQGRQEGLRQRMCLVITHPMRLNLALQGHSRMHDCWWQTLGLTVEDPFHQICWEVTNLWSSGRGVGLGSWWDGQCFFMSSIWSSLVFCFKTLDIMSTIIIHWIHCNGIYPTQVKENIAFPII